MRHEIGQRYKTEESMLPVFRERLQTEVVRWAYTIDEIWSYRDLRARGSDSSHLTGPEGAFYAYGYDNNDRPIVVIHFDTQACYSDPQTGKHCYKRIPTKDRLVEEFIWYIGDTLNVARFLSSALQCVNRLKFADGMLIEEEDFLHGVYRHNCYQYENKRLVLQQCLNDKDRVFFEIVSRPHTQRTYFRVRTDGTRFQLYQPLPKGVTVKSLQAAIRARLLELIPLTVKNAAIEEAIYCVVLAYDGEGGDALPPMIGIGLESERRHWVAAHGKKAAQRVWNPAEFLHYEKAHTQFDDDALEEACDLLNSKLAERDSAAPAIKVLIEVAAELNKWPWPLQVLRTPDFVVYAVDLEMGSLRKNLKACLTSEQLTTMKDKKLV